MGSRGAGVEFSIGEERNCAVETCDPHVTYYEFKNITLI